MLFSPEEVRLLKLLASSYVSDPLWSISNGLSYQVNSKEDFPAPVGGVITLPANTHWHLMNDIDLQGDRLVCAGTVSIAGSSSETAFLRSTGLVGQPLISSAYSLPMRNLSIVADVAVSLDALGHPGAAIDWIAVNFVNCPTVGTIKDYTNWTILSCAFLNSGGVTLDGTIGTVGAIQTLFDCAPGTTMITVAPTATVSRRIRFIACAWVVLAGETGIHIDPTAIVPVEGYILQTCNFGGGGTYTTGVLYSDNKARFEGCRGINNSASVTQYYMSGNSTPTVISATNTYVKIAGTTLPGSYTERFTLTDNRAEYDGALIGYFRVTATLSLTAGNNNQIRAAVARNGTVLPESVGITTANASGRSENVTIQTVVELDGPGVDFIEIFVANSTAIVNITVTELSVIIERLN